MLQRKLPYLASSDPATGQRSVEPGSTGSAAAVIGTRCRVLTGLAGRRSQKGSGSSPTAAENQAVGPAAPGTSVRAVAAGSQRGSTWTDRLGSSSAAEALTSAAGPPGTGCRCGLGVGDSLAARAEDCCWVEADRLAPVNATEVAAEGLQARHCRVVGTGSLGPHSGSVAVQGWLGTAPARIQAAYGVAASKLLAQDCEGAVAAAAVAAAAVVAVLPVAALEALQLGQSAVAVSAA